MPFTVRWPIGLEEVSFDNFQLVRGAVATYDLAAQFTTPPTGNYLETVPTTPGISINASTGVITADLTSVNLTNRFGFTDETLDDGLQIYNEGYHFTGHDDGYMTIPITYRDWFPSDLEIAPVGFVSMDRAHDGSADEILFSVVILSPTTGEVVVDETDISTGDDGYLDRQDILDVYGNLQDGIIAISRLREQMTGGWLTQHNEDEHGVIGYISNGTTTFFESDGTNGSLVMRGEWDASDWDSGWTHTNTEAFYTLHGSMFSVGPGWAMLTTISNRDSGDSGNILDIGDWNAWPGLEYVGNNQYRSTSNVGGTNLTVANLGNVWTTWYTSALYDNFLSSTRRRLQVFRLDTQGENSTRSGTTQTQTFGGLRVRLRDYNFAEFIIFDIDTVGESTTFKDSTVPEDYANNCAWRFRGSDRSYT